MKEPPDLFDDPNLTFSKLGAAWLLTLDPRMKVKGFSRDICAEIRMKSVADAEELKDLVYAIASSLTLISSTRRSERLTCLR